MGLANAILLYMNMGITVTEVDDEETRRTVREMIAREYSQLGYASTDSEHAMRSMHYDGEFGLRLAAIGDADNDLIGTIAIAIDSADLLPMDSLYEKGTTLFRESGLRIAEVGQFAVTKNVSAMRRLHIVRKLFTAVLIRLKENKIDALVITINPKHDSAYSLMGFSTFGATKPYDAVNGALAVPKVKFVSLKGLYARSNFTFVTSPVIVSDEDAHSPVTI